MSNLTRRRKAGRLQDGIDRYLPISGHGECTVTRRWRESSAHAEGRLGWFNRWEPLWSRVRSDEQSIFVAPHTPRIGWTSRELPERRGGAGASARCANRRGPAHGTPDFSGLSQASRPRGFTLSMSRPGGSRRRGTARMTGAMNALLSLRLRVLRTGVDFTLEDRVDHDGVDECERKHHDSSAPEDECEAPRRCSRLVDGERKRHDIG